MDKQQAANVLQKQLEMIPSLKDFNPDHSDFELWKENCLTIFKELFRQEKNWQYNFEWQAFRVNRIKMVEEGDYFTDEDRQAFLKGLQTAEVTIKAALNKLELFDIKPNLAPSVGKGGLSIQISNNLSSKQTLNLNISFEQIIQAIEVMKIPDTEKIEAKSKVEDIKIEMGKDHPSWEKIKGMLIWLINFSKEIFLKILPLILDKYAGTS